MSKCMCRTEFERQVLKHLKRIEHRLESLEEHMSALDDATASLTEVTNTIAEAIAEQLAELQRQLDEAGVDASENVAVINTQVERLRGITSDEQVPVDETPVETDPAAQPE